MFSGTSLVPGCPNHLIRFCGEDLVQYFPYRIRDKGTQVIPKLLVVNLNYLFGVLPYIIIYGGVSSVLNKFLNSTFYLTGFKKKCRLFLNLRKI